MAMKDNKPEDLEDKIEEDEGGYAGDSEDLDEDDKDKDELDTDNADEDDAEDAPKGEEAKDEDAEPEDKKPKAKDPKEAKIIDLKRQLKEAENKAAESERRHAEETMKKEAESKIADLMDEGYTEKEAKRIADAEYKAALYERQLIEVTFREEAKEFPSILQYKNEIAAFAATHPDMTVREIYLAKFYRKSASDERTQLEQEFQHRQSESKKKGITSEKGTPTKRDNVTLTKSDESAFLLVQKNNPQMTRAQFAKLQEDEELT